MNNQSRSQTKPESSPLWMKKWPTRRPAVLLMTQPRPQASSPSSDPLPGQLGAGGSVSGAVADIEIAADGDESNLAVGAGSEGDVSLLDLVEEVLVPDVHLDDPPTCQTARNIARRLTFPRA